MDPIVVPSSQRRKFLMVMLGGIGGVVTAAFAWPVLRFLSPAGPGDEGGTVKVDRNQVPVGGAHFFQFHGHSAVVIQPEPGKFVALTAVCTHLGCVVGWKKDKGEFLCPCHGGRFSPEGKVLGGPPPKPLETYALSVEGDQIVVG